MKSRILLMASTLLVVSCAGVRPVQLQPPTAAPPGLRCGYGVEKIRRNPELARRRAYLSAVDDPITCSGPLVVSKVVYDRTSVVNDHSARRNMESTFRLRASSIIEPRYLDSGTEDGFSWALVATTEADIERGWHAFLSWRQARSDEALELYESAAGPTRLGFLQASLRILDEVGAQDDAGFNYYRVKIALDSELARIAELESLRKQAREFLASGQLVAADKTLDRGLHSGLSAPDYESLKYQIANQRVRAMSMAQAGDALYAEGRYKEALERCGEARRLDVDHPAIAGKISMAEASHRTARAESRRRWIGFIGFTASRAIGEYFEHKRDEGSAHDEEGDDEEEEDSEEKKKPEEKEPDDEIPEWMKRTRVRVDDESVESAYDSSDEESRDDSESESESDDSENDDLDNGGRTEEDTAEEDRPVTVKPVLRRIPANGAKKPGPL